MAFLLRQSVRVGTRRLLPALYATRGFSAGVVAPSQAQRTASNPQLNFPCLDVNQDRERSLDGGPEPAYEKIATGYKTFSHKQPFLLDHGGVLPSFEIAYETWGQLNKAKDNVILIHTGLSGSSHAKSHPDNTSKGWWEDFIGPGLYIDTNKFFVICTNVIGGCYGSTGPSSVDPADGERYATRFPILTIFDMVRAQFFLLDHLGVDRLHASVGSSMGGMQSIAAASLFPQRVNRVISISGCARSHPYSIALRHTQRSVLMNDPNWNKGFYYKGHPPHVGMKASSLAREIATITYRSGPEWEQRFGRKRAHEDQSPALCPDFLIETYLDHQGERFCLQYDANSLLYVSKAMDLFDMSASARQKLQGQRDRNKVRFAKLLQDQGEVEACKIASPVSSLEPHAVENNKENLQEDVRSHLKTVADRPALSSLPNTPDLQDLVAGMRNITMPSLVIGVQSDILFPVWQQKEIAECLRLGGNKNVTYYELDSMYGHDTFLIDKVGIGSAIKGHLELLE